MAAKRWTDTIDQIRGQHRTDHSKVRRNERPTERADFEPLLTNTSKNNANSPCVHIR